MGVYRPRSVKVHVGDALLEFLYKLRAMRVFFELAIDDCLHGHIAKDVLQHISQFIDALAGIQGLHDAVVGPLLLFTAFGFDVCTSHSGFVQPLAELPRVSAPKRTQVRCVFDLEVQGDDTFPDARLAFLPG